MQSEKTDGSSSSQSLFVETYGLEVEEQLSTLATQYWAEGVWIGKMAYEQREVLMTQRQEVQFLETGESTCRSSVCETRDLGRQWPQWHTLTFEAEVRIDMRYVCPKDVNKMFLQRGRTVYWKKEQQSMKMKS